MDRDRLIQEHLQGLRELKFFEDKISELKEESFNLLEFADESEVNSLIRVLRAKIQLLNTLDAAAGEQETHYE